MSDYDQRQYRRMIYKLECIEGGDFASELLADLTALLGALEKPEPSWERAFLGGVGSLDEDISGALVDLEDEDAAASRARPSFDEATVERMKATAAKLKQLVLTKIEGPLGDLENIE